MANLKNKNRCYHVKKKHNRSLDNNKAPAFWLATISAVGNTNRLGIINHTECLSRDISGAIVGTVAFEESRTINQRIAALVVFRADEHVQAGEAEIGFDKIRRTSSEIIPFDCATKNESRLIPVNVCYVKTRTHKLRHTLVPSIRKMNRSAILPQRHIHIDGN